MKAAKRIMSMGAMALVLSGLSSMAAEKERVLFFTAHPEDIVSSAGTILLMRDKFEVHVCNYTEGAQGLSPEAVTALRGKEEKVCRELGAQLHWYNAEGGRRWVEESSCRRFANLLAELKPRAVFGHWPVDTDSDHMMSCAVLQKAVQLAKLECEFYFFERSSDSKGFPPAFYVNITSIAKEKERILHLFDAEGKADAQVESEKRNSATNGERLNLVDPETGFSRSQHCNAEVFASYGGHPQGPIIFAELPYLALPR